jgi:L-lactate dehydrogenase complex protein LldG
MAPEALLDQLEERLVDYRATVHRATWSSVASVVAACLGDRGVARLVVPDGFPAEWLEKATAEQVADAPPLTPHQLDALDGVVTTATLAVAETGTIVLDGSAGQGRRALSLVPDYHLVVVGADQVVAGVPDAVAALDPLRAMTWISGPSATSDIELVRVEGVHGPRTLEVVLLA